MKNEKFSSSLKRRSDKFSREIICKNLGFVCGPICVSQVSGAVGTFDHGYIKFVSVHCSSHIDLHFQLTTMALSSLDHVKYKHNNRLAMAQIRS